jgi:hypothetical protein
VQGKVKVYFWRLVENDLAVDFELKHRRIKYNITYLVCGKEERLMHHVLDCSHSALVWKCLKEEAGVSPEKPPTRLANHSELKGWLLDWIGKSDRKLVSLSMMMVYLFRLARNDARESKCIEVPMEITMRTVAGIDEWICLHNYSLSKTMVPERWLSPSPGWFKINVDGAIR